VVGKVGGSCKVVPGRHCEKSDVDVVMERFVWVGDKAIGAFNFLVDRFDGCFFLAFESFFLKRTDLFELALFELVLAASEFACEAAPLFFFGVLGFDVLVVLLGL